MGNQCEAFFALIGRFAANRSPADPVAASKAVSAARDLVSVSLQRACAQAVQAFAVASDRRLHSRYGESGARDRTLSLATEH